MPTRISACVGDHPCSLLFIAMIPIDYKITNFFLILFVIFFLRDHHNYFLAHTQLIIKVENLLATTFHIQSFLTHYTVV